jgi:hypothetical protein
LTILLYSAGIVKLPVLHSPAYRMTLMKLSSAFGAKWNVLT